MRIADLMVRVMEILTSLSVCSWFVNLSTVSGFFSWLGMHITYLFFCTSLTPSTPRTLYSPARHHHADRGMKAQGFDRTKLVYHSKLQPYLSIWGIFWVSIFILVNGIAVFWDFNASDFLTSCTCFLLRPSPLFSSLRFADNS